jgi:hypothetical protein
MVSSVKARRFSSFLCMMPVELRPIFTSDHKTRITNDKHTGWPCYSFVLNQEKYESN